MLLLLSIIVIIVKILQRVNSRNIFKFQIFEISIMNIDSK